MNVLRDVANFAKKLMKLFAYKQKKMAKKRIKKGVYREVNSFVYNNFLFCFNFL